MARITDTKTTKKYAKITFEFEHDGAIHSRVSKLNVDDYWLMSDRDLKRHIRVRANHERSKIDNKRKTPEKEEQGKKSEVSEIEESAQVEKGLEQQPDMETEQDQ